MCNRPGNLGGRIRILPTTESNFLNQIHGYELASSYERGSGKWTAMRTWAAQCPPGQTDLIQLKDDSQRGLPFSPNNPIYLLFLFFC